MAAYFYTRKKTREMQCHEFLCLCLEIPSVINLKTETFLITFPLKNTPHNIVKPETLLFWVSDYKYLVSCKFRIYNKSNYKFLGKTYQKS